MVKHHPPCVHPTTAYTLDAFGVICANCGARMTPVKAAPLILAASAEPTLYERLKAAWLGAISGWRNA